MSKRILIIAAGLLLALTPCISEATERQRVPVQADLVRAIEAGRVKVGDTVLARVAVKWQSPDCTLREGAILKGRIVAQNIHSKTEKTSQIALLFDNGQCGGPDMKSLPMTVAAVLASDPAQDKNQYENQPLSEAVGLSIGGTGGGSAGVGVGGGGGNLRSVTAAAATVYVSPPVYKGPTAVMPGQVVGIRGMKLNVGGGPEGSSVLSISGHNVRLESGAQLLLVLNANASAPVAASEPTAASPTTSASSASVSSASVSTPANETTITETADETDVCLPPLCNVALSSDETESPAAAASASFPLRELGFTPERADREMYGFDYGSAIAYLGQNGLLFTFNPHLLIHRNGTEAQFAKLRVIRAVLINAQDQKVEKTVDWKVPDAQQYLWQMGQGRVLVHVGRDLRVYGLGLKLERRLPLDGPLAFVRISPSAKYFAVGVVHERHTEAVHRELAEAEEREPEEDLEIKVFDANFRALATVARSSRSAPPVLSDDGEIRILSARKNRWRIVEETWNTQNHLVAQVTSSCRPQATTMPPNLLFLVGCDPQNAAKWYRVLRPSGKPVLKGSSSSTELERTASGSAAGGAFTIGMAEAGKSIAPDSAFQTSDLLNERIAVYRAENGQRVFSIAVAAPAPTVQTFVLSPAGDRLAVLEGDKIALYQIPGARGSSENSPVISR
ncbi:MAG: hypothetical protein WBX38_08755 [Candidatus Sulfotelmatobacter sp.]